MALPRADALNVAVPWWSGGVHAVSAITTPPTFEPLTLEDAKLRAGFKWLAGDERDALLSAYISAARAKVEQDTGLALPLQTRDVRFDYLVTDGPLLLPGVCAPLRRILTASTVNPDGTETPLDPSGYVIDSMSHPARILIASSSIAQKTTAQYQPLHLQIEAGWATAAEIPPLLVHAVGLLATHYLTLGRDIIVVGTITSDVPFGYDHVISGFIPTRID